MSKSKNMRDHANELADKLAPHVESAREKAAPILADAKVKAAPMLAEVKGKTSPALTDARDKLTNEVLPVITAAIAAASEATEEARNEAMKRGAATAAALKGELEPPRQKTHRLRNLMMVLGLGGIAAFVAKKLSDREATTAWQSSYQPTPASTPPAPDAGESPTMYDDTPTATAAAAAAGAHLSDDEGAAGPDEAAADAMEMPHAATAPDNPADEVHLKKDGPDVP